MLDTLDTLDGEASIPGENEAVVIQAGGRHSPLGEYPYSRQENERQGNLLEASIDYSRGVILSRRCIQRQDCRRSWRVPGPVSH